MSEEGEVSEDLENAMEGYYGLSTTSSSTSVCEDSSAMAIDYDERDMDVQEEADCSFHFGAGKKACSSLLRYEDVMDYRGNCLELSRAELDMVILGQINSQLSPQSHTKFFYKGDRVCMNTFLFLHAISDKWYSDLYKHWKTMALHLKSTEVMVNLHPMLHLLKQWKLILHLYATLLLPWHYHFLADFQTLRMSMWYCCLLI